MVARGGYPPPSLDFNITNERIPREPQEKSHLGGPGIARSPAYELSEPSTTRFPFFSVPTMNAMIEGLFGYLYNQTPPILVSEMQSRSRWSRLRDPLILIPILGLLCADLVLASNVLLSITAGDVFALLLGTPLLTLYTLSLLALWWRPRAGYIMSTVVSAVSLFIFVGIGNPLPTLAGPRETTGVPFATSFPPACVTRRVYSHLRPRAQSPPPDTAQPAQT